MSTAAAKKLRLLYKYIKRRAQSSHRHPEPDQRCMQSASYPAALFSFNFFLLASSQMILISREFKKKKIDLILKGGNLFHLTLPQGKRPMKIE